ncbi:MAG: MCP four helix bundle domain-containing protein, partial [Polaromonas sp.]
MQWFLNLKISNKLIIGFLTILVMTSIVGIFSILQLSAVSQSSTAIATGALPGTSNALKMKVTLARYRLSELQHILAHEDDVLLDEAQSLDVRLAELKKYQAAYDTLHATPS